MHKRILLFFLFSFIGFIAKSQCNMPLDRDLLLPYQSAFNSTNCNVFTSAMPYDAGKIAKALIHDTIPGYRDLIFKDNGPMLDLGRFTGNIFPLGGGSGG